MGRKVDLVLGDGSRVSYDVPDHYTPQEEAAITLRLGAKPDWLIPMRRQVIDAIATSSRTLPMDQFSEIPGLRWLLDIALPSSEEEIAADMALGAFGGYMGKVGKALFAEGTLVQKVAPTALRAGMTGLVGGTVAAARGVEDYNRRAAMMAAGSIFGEAAIGTGSFLGKNWGAVVPKNVSEAWAKRLGDALDPIFPNAKTEQDLLRLFHGGEAKTAIKNYLDNVDAQIFIRLAPETTLVLPSVTNINRLIPKRQRIPTIKGPEGQDFGMATFGDAFNGLRTLRAVRRDLLDAGKGAQAGQLLDQITLYEAQLHRAVQHAAPDVALLMNQRLERARKMYAVDEAITHIPGFIESTPTGPRVHTEKLYDALTWRANPQGPSMLETLSKAGLDDFVAALYPPRTGPGFGVSQWELGPPFIRGRVGNASVGERVPIGTRITTYPGGPPGPQVPRTLGAVGAIRGEEALQESGLIPGFEPPQ